MSDKISLNKKSQTAIEFVALVGTLLFIFVTFFLLIQQNTWDKEYRRETALVNELAASIRDEIGIAAKASDGYIRNFTIQYKVVGKDYSLQLNETEKVLLVSTNRVSTALNIEKVNGTVQKGNNQIKKINGTIYINK